MAKVNKLLKWSKSRYLVKETTKDKTKEIEEALRSSFHSEYPLYNEGEDSSDGSRGSPF